MDKKINKNNITFDKLPQETLVHKLESTDSNKKAKLLISGFVIILCGVFTGFLLSSKLSLSGSITGTSDSKSGKSSAKVIVGSPDAKLYPDSAEGILEVGHINGEGTHKLIRSGGESQTVYLISSLLDLNQFTGKKVKVWGQTFAGEKAGWLMDVGKVEQLE